MSISGNETSEAFKLLINVVFNYLFYDLNRKANDLVKTLLAEEGLLEENLSKRVKKNDTALREMMRRNKRMQKALADVSEHLRRGTQISGTDQVALPQQSYAFLTDTVRKLDADIKEDSSVQESTAVLLSEADAQLKAIEVESYNNYKLMLWECPTLDKSIHIGVDAHSYASPKEVIIDGQQRLTSLYAVMKGKKVINSKFDEKSIIISYCPLQDKFEVGCQATKNDPEWIYNISDLFTTTNSFKFIGDFIRKLGDHRAAKGNALTDEEQGLIAERINSVFNLKSHTLPIFDIKANAEEEDVSEIFVRVNSGGVSLKQNDFILTLLSLYWDEGRREIERFSKESTTPCKGKTTSYNPLTTVSAQDVIRVVMAYAFDRARLKYGYKLLRGADFDRKGAVDENLRTTRFDILKERLPDVLDVHSWHEFIKAIMNAGYLSGEMILSGNAIFYTYALYLIAKHRFHASYNEDMHLTSLWFFYASLVSLYTGSFESTVEKHLNTIKGLKTLSEYKEFILSRINERLTNDFFDITLVGSEGLAVSGRGNNAWNAYVASLNIMNAKILFSKSNLFVSKLFEPGTDGNRKSLEKHHLFPKAYLKSLNCTDAKINQMANYALIDWKDNMDILDDAPSVYYPIICAGMSDEQIRVMEEENALPHGWENMSYDDFLIERRKLMAAKIKIAFEVLKKAVTE